MQMPLALPILNCGPNHRYVYDTNNLIHIDRMITDCTTILIWQTEEGNVNATVAILFVERTLGSYNKDCT